MASKADCSNNVTAPSAAPPAAPPAATSGCTEAAISLVPSDATFIVRRFHSEQDQHPPVGLRQAPSEAEAESKMLVQLRAFDEKFGNTSARN
ncbi:hypothetical protein TGAM01_v205851 [Trichoderma gamsii]|uniref:Uncharacterized protein n=1 Tax=Trichoderma gamsii TaxID=398673 RepID=A0A2P4ZLN6_9HYPO|nr:hypothetical protein TGAM01_v205851 [Trichoderma gamsii]PON25165.1 hypothetical protein TGAM01_v205851 [Trichoderma gamsii]